MTSKSRSYEFLVQKMGRPSASDTNRQFAVHFARLVTRQSEFESMIARCGVCSIYDLLKKLRPGLVRDPDQGPRDGLSEVEFNKALQVK